MRNAIWCLCLLFATVKAVAADPITITGGELVGDRQGVAVTLAGPGFALTGIGDSVGGFWGPFNSCSPCVPGAPVMFNAQWSGSDFRGTVDIGGQTYLMGSVGPDTANVAVEWVAANGVAPAFTGATTASVTAPFTFHGVFRYPNIPSTEPPAPVPFAGFGTATVNLVWRTESGFEYWVFDNARYVFESANPVPEPGTLFLIGTGAVTALVQHRRRRRRS